MISNKIIAYGNVVSDEMGNQYLSFTAKQPNSTIMMVAVGNAPSVTLVASYDGFSWFQFVVGETTLSLPNVGDKVYIRAVRTNERMGRDEDNYNTFSISGQVSASGNIQSLLGTNEITANYCFYGLFYNCSSLISAPELPATELASYCYSYMFYGCTSLTKAPELPATKLNKRCYAYMFYKCTSLTQASELPATELDSYCYYGMFDGCTSLTQAPSILPAITLATGCYRGMFLKCTSLTQAPTLPATMLVDECYYKMFYNCTSLNNINVDFSAWYPASATSLWVGNVASSGTFSCPIGLIEEFGTSHIPVNWTVIHHWGLCFTAEEPNSTIRMTKGEYAPEVSLYTSIDGRNWTSFIPNETIITLANVGDTIYFKAGNSGNNRFCATNEATPEYANIFSLTGKIAASGNIMSLLDGDNPTTELHYDYTFAQLFRNCISLTTTPELPATILSKYCYTNMFSGCISLTQATELPATTLTDICYYGMFRDCTSLTQAPALPATTLSRYCYHKMFSGCKSLTQAPELPATTLTEKCYSNMFNGCTQLNEIKTAQTSFYNCNDWVANVSQTGTFYCPSVLGTNDTISRGNSACPYGWNVDNVMV